MLTQEEVHKARRLFLQARQCRLQHYVFVPQMGMCEHCIQHCAAYKARRAKWLARMKYLRAHPVPLDEYGNVL